MIRLANLLSKYFCRLFYSSSQLLMLLSLVDITATMPATTPPTMLLSFSAGTPTHQFTLRSVFLPLPSR